MADLAQSDLEHELTRLRQARYDILGCLTRIDHLSTPERADWLAALNGSLERKILLLTTGHPPNRRQKS